MMDEMVTIACAEHERLLEAAEDLADLQAYDRAMAEGGEGVPAAIVNRILDGEPPVRAFRDWRGLSAAELGRRSGVQQVAGARDRDGQEAGIGGDAEAAG